MQYKGEIELTIHRAKPLDGGYGITFREHHARKLKVLVFIEDCPSINWPPQEGDVLTIGVSRSHLVASPPRQLSVPHEPYPGVAGRMSGAAGIGC